MSCVLRSISRSSAVRSVKPGRTCLACSLSSAVTAGQPKDSKTCNEGGSTFPLYATQDLFHLITRIHPIGISSCPSQGPHQFTNRDRRRTISEADPSHLSVILGSLSISPPPHYPPHRSYRHTAPAAPAVFWNMRWKPSCP